MMDNLNNEIKKALAERNFKEASKISRAIFSLTGDACQELNARIFDLIDNPPVDLKLAESYIDNFIAKYPELEALADNKLGEYFFTVRGSVYKAYQRFKKVSLDIANPEAVFSVKKRLEILKDVESASKALRKLKPYSKASDAILLAQERLNLVYESIPILALEDKGYLYWEDFLNGFPNISLKPFLAELLVSKIEKWTDLITDNLIKKSYIHTTINVGLSKSEHLESDGDVIWFLRTAKAGSLDADQLKKIEPILDGAITYVEINNNLKNRLWTRFYLVIINAILGNHQKANDMAITLLHMARSLDEEKKLCLMLGLFAFGYSQLRIGNEIEGLLCVLSAMEFCIEIEELTPFVEDGLNVIFRFHQDNRALFEESNSVINTFFEKLAPQLNSGDINKSLISDNTESSYNRLLQEVKQAEIKNADWAANVSNLIAISYRLDKITEAVDFIKNYYIEAIPLLSMRKDLRPNILKNWAELLFLKLRSETFFETISLIQNFLEIAANDIEEKRQVSHKQERAFLGDKARDIYVFYLEILAILFNTRDISTKEKDEIFNKIQMVLSRLQPRAIIEKKLFNSNKKYTKEAIEKEQKYIDLITEIEEKQKQGFSIDEYKDKIEYAQELYTYLVQNHQAYMPLPKLEDIEFKTIAESLAQNDLLYQYIKTPHGLFTLILSKTKVDIDFNFFESNRLEAYDSCEEVFKQGLLREDKDVIKEGSQIFSRLFYANLLQYLDKNIVENLYIFSDMSIPFFSPNLVSGEDYMLVEKVCSIRNIIDYRAIKSNTGSDYNNLIIGKAFGSTGDDVIQITSEWLKKQSENFIGINNLSNDVSEVKNICLNNRPQTLLIFAHGIMDANAAQSDGAIGLQGNSKTINIENILNFYDTYKNLVLISFRGGRSFENQIESNSGVWGSIFEYPVSDIVLCRWDVPVPPSLKILEMTFSYLEEENWDFSRALNKAQRELASKCFLTDWAGLEYWKN